MSDIETSMPSRADILSVIGGLEALRPAATAAAPAVLAPPNALDAAQARHDQDAAALRDMTADRDAWRTAAERIQTELWRQMEVLRTELEQQRASGAALGAEVAQLRADRDAMGTELLQHRDQVGHLNAALTSLLEIATSRAAATAAAATLAGTERPTDGHGYGAPRGLGLPSTQPAPPPSDPNAPPMVIPSLAPDPRPPARAKPRRAVAPVAPVPSTAPTAPAAEPVAAPLPPVVEFTAPEPDGARAGILPTAGPEKKRRLRLS